MSALVSILNQGERTKMPPISSILPPVPGQQSKTPKKSFNGDSNSKSRSFLPPRTPSKKRLKWSIEKNKQESSPENEKNKSNDIKSRLSSRSASSFFSSKPVIVVPHEDTLTEEPCNGSQEFPVVANLTADIERQGSGIMEGIMEGIPGDISPSRLSEDDSLLLTPQSSSRCSTGSFLNYTDKVAEEILTTERTYVKNLAEIIEGYLKYMHMKNCPISRADVQSLFINIEKIYEFNREFLKQLEKTDDDPVEIAECFVNNEGGFQAYTDYCTNYPKSVEVLTEYTRQREASTFIQEIQMNLGHSLPLGSYLLKPVQRILKYHLLLQAMKKHYDKESDIEGYEIICDALFAMTDVAIHINEMKRQHEAALHVQEIQSQLSEFEGPDLTTYGNLILEDSFRVLGTRTDRYLFLFEKILLITKKRERDNGYTCKATVLLSNMMMTESLPKEPLAFQIIRFDNQKVNYPFLARNTDQKSKWTLELKRLLVESLVAEVPLKAKALILGEKNVDEDENSEICSPATPRRQSLKGSSSSHSLAKRRLTLDSEQTKEDENNNPNYDNSENEVFLADVESLNTFSHANEEHNRDCVGVSVGSRVGDWERRVESQQAKEDPSHVAAEELAALRRPRTGSLDSDLPRPRKSDSSKEDRIKSTGATVELPWIPKRSSTSKLLEARLSRDKCVSASDLLGSLDENATNGFGLTPSDSEIDITRELGDITENSKIHQTVREVARAFSFSEQYPTSDHPVLSMRDDQARESGEVKVSKKGRRSLDDLLATIDRELDETRRTINSAQLLESAIRLKQVSPLNVMWPPQESAQQAKHVEPKVDSVDSRSLHLQPEIEARKPPQPPDRSSVSCIERNRDHFEADEEERDLKAELAAFEKRAPQFSRLAISDKNRTCSLDRRRGKKVFEFPRAKADRYSTGDIAGQTPPEKPLSVQKLARQYSQKVTDQKSMQSIRSRFSSEDLSGSDMELSPLRVDASPRLKVERVTKVTFDNSLIESSRVLRRRRRSRSRQQRASWAHENVQVDIDVLRLKIERPRSLHEIKPPKELIELDDDEEYIFPDGLDEGLAPALLAGMQKDDVVVRGLVKHLVSKFGADETESVSNPSSPARLL